MADSKNHVPGPYHKVKDRHLYGTTGLNDRNFSFGERIDLSKPANDNPSAIYYNPAGITQLDRLDGKFAVVVRTGASKMLDLETLALP